MGRKAEVRLYFDADILGLAKVICALRSDSTYPGDKGAEINKWRRPACIVPDPKWKDRQWIPPVAKQGWVAISRDSDILDHLSLLQLIDEHRLRFVAIVGDDGGTKWGPLEIVMTHWREIEALAERDGPLLYTTTRTTFKRVDLRKRLKEVRREAAENPHYPADVVSAETRQKKQTTQAPATQQGTLFDS